MEINDQMFISEGLAQLYCKKRIKRDNKRCQGAHREEDGEKAWFVRGGPCVCCHFMTESPGAFKRQ